MVGWLWLVFLLICGCAESLHDRAWLERELRQRTGNASRVLNMVGEQRDHKLPNGVDLADGLDEEEVIVLALLRNPSLRAELTRIDAAQATVNEANRPANPQLSVLAPIGPISAVATIVAPLESLWQLPQRAEVAVQDANVVADTVLMNALDIVRDARLLHVELALAADRAHIRKELEKTSQELARIANVRARLGDINPVDAYVFTADSHIASDLSERARVEQRIACIKLLAQLALNETAFSGVAATFGAVADTPRSMSELIDIASVTRPDTRAASYAIEAAAKRAGWERTRITALSAQVEHHWAQPEPAFRVGGRVDLPLFGLNPGGVGRADAEVARAMAQHEAVTRAARLELVSAHARAKQASRSLRRFEASVLPQLDQGLTTAVSVFESGDESYILVLDLLRRTGEARIRHAELVAEQRRAGCELERALGARLRPDTHTATSFVSLEGHSNP